MGAFVDHVNSGIHDVERGLDKAGKVVKKLLSKYTYK